MNTDEETDIIPIQQFESVSASLKIDSDPKENNSLNAKATDDCGISSGIVCLKYVNNRIWFYTVSTCFKKLLNLLQLAQTI